MKIFENSSLDDTDIVIHLSAKDGLALHQLVNTALHGTDTGKPLRKTTRAYKLGANLLEDLPVF